MRQLELATASHQVLWDLRFQARHTSLLKPRQRHLLRFDGLPVSLLLVRDVVWQMQQVLV